LYEFYRDHLGLPECVEARAALSAGQDPVPVIVAGAVRQEPCPLCRRAIDLFLTILGSEAGNLALKLFARGGVYLGGGILPRLYGKVPFAGFLRSFHAKGHMAGLMTTIPVHLILRQDAAVLGAASYGLAASRGLLLGTAHG
jgi:glucokinase